MKRPEVFKSADTGAWCSMLRHEGWAQYAEFGTWEYAMEHALWLYVTNAGRSR